MTHYSQYWLVEAAGSIKRLRFIHVSMQAALSVTDYPRTYRVDCTDCASVSSSACVLDPIFVWVVVLD